MPMKSMQRHGSGYCPCACRDCFETAVSDGNEARLGLAEHLAKCARCEHGEQRCRVGRRRTEEALAELEYELCHACKAAGCDPCDCEDAEDCVQSKRHDECQAPGAYDVDEEE